MIIRRPHQQHEEKNTHQGTKREVREKTRSEKGGSEQGEEIRGRTREGKKEPGYCVNKKKNSFLLEAEKKNFFISHAGGGGGGKIWAHEIREKRFRPDQKKKTGLRLLLQKGGKELICLELGGPK